MNYITNNYSFIKYPSVLDESLNSIEFAEDLIPLYKIFLIIE